MRQNPHVDRLWDNLEQIIEFHRGPERPRKILLLEDNSDDAKLFLLTLTEAAPNCACSVARNIAEAMELLRKQAFDIAFIDIRLPGEDGVEFVGVLKGMTSPPRVVMITAIVVDSALINRVKAAGAMSIIEKPLTVQHLREILLTT